MKCGVFALFLSVAALGLPVSAQTPDSNPAHVPDANISNDRPLIKKKEKAPTSRTLTGKVVGEVSGTPLKGAIVTLTDLNTHEQRSSITKEDGRFVFDDLSFTIDYEVKARYKNAATDVRKISQYDHMPKVVRILNMPEADGTAPASEAKKNDKE